MNQSLTLTVIAVCATIAAVLVVGYLTIGGAAGIAFGVAVSIAVFGPAAKVKGLSCRRPWSR